MQKRQKDTDIKKVSQCVDFFNCVLYDNKRFFEVRMFKVLKKHKFA